MKFDKILELKLLQIKGSGLLSFKPTSFEGDVISAKQVVKDSGDEQAAHCSWNGSSHRCLQSTWLAGSDVYKGTTLTICYLRSPFIINLAAGEAIRLSLLA